MAPRDGTTRDGSSESDSNDFRSLGRPASVHLYPLAISDAYLDGNSGPHTLGDRAEIFKLTQYPVKVRQFRTFLSELDRHIDVLDAQAIALIAINEAGRPGRDATGVLLEFLQREQQTCRQAVRYRRQQQVRWRRAFALAEWRWFVGEQAGYRLSEVHQELVVLLLCNRDAYCFSHENSPFKNRLRTTSGTVPPSLSALTHAGLFQHDFKWAELREAALQKIGTDKNREP